MSSELGNIVQFSEQFPLQSYFSALAEVTTPPSTAALQQSVNTSIVGSTLKTKANQSGYAIGLAPWSQAPVALKINFGEGGNSAAVLLKPGQVFRPNGRESFKGFEYGLPFGWLGGGTVTLFLFKTPAAEVWWEGTQSEVLYHRLRTTILTAPAAAPSYKNWPNKFPWSQMYRYIAGGPQESQQGQPTLVISQTTRVSLRLNSTADYTGDNLCAMFFWGTDDFGIGADGITAVNTDSFAEPLAWPTGTGMQGGRPLLSLSREVAAQASNQWGISIVAPIGSALIGQTVDICRYGIL